MRTGRLSERVIVGSGLLVGLCLAAVAVLFGLFVFMEHQAVKYPGSVQIAGHDSIQWFPRFFYRQDASFRTPDDFTSVFNWYSSGFDLGPERAAQSSCSLISDTVNRFGIETVTAVTVCDTPNGRMVFVQRSLEFDLR